MKKYLNLIRRQTNQTFVVKFLQVPREENEHAYRLAKATSAEHIMVDRQVLSFVQQSLAIEELEIQMIPKGVDQTTPIISYLKNRTLLEDRDESQRLIVRAARFMLIADVLYKRGFSRSNKVNYVMREAYEGMYGNHLRARSLVHKLIRAGYYWPTMQKDT